MTDDGTLSSWLENHVGAWLTDPPRHCMSDFYYPTHKDNISYPKPPLFLRTDLRMHRDDDWPTRPKGLGTRPKDIKSFRERNEKRLDLALSVYDKFATRLEGDGCREEHLYLLKLRNDFKVRAEKLAGEIDDEYCVKGEDTDTTNVLEEAAKFHNDLQAALQDSAPKQDTLNDAFQGNLETIEWSVSTRMGKFTSLKVSSADANDPIFQLGRPQTRSCLDLSEAGYKCGIDYLPADASLQSIERLFRSYFKELELEVNRMGNTQALLCYKLQVLQWVLREYAIFDTIDTITRGYLERRIDNPLPNCLTGKGYSMDVDRLLDAVHEYVIASSNADSAWSDYSQIDASNVYDHLKKKRKDVLKKSNGETIDENTLRRWLRKVPDDYKEEWCRQAGFGEDH